MSAAKTQAKGRRTKKSAAKKAAPDRAPERPADQGRKAKPVSMSLMPHEHAELEEFTALTDIGPTTLYRDLVAPKIHAAVWALKEMVAAGVEIRAHNLPPTIWHPEATPGELDDLYSGVKPSNDLAE